MRKNKANAKASLKNKKENVIIDSGGKQVDSDTLAYNKGDPFTCANIKMVFFKPAKRRKDQTDTLTVGFRQPGNEPNDLDLVQIDSYLLKLGKHDLIKIKLVGCDTDSRKNEALHSVYLQRSERITEYLKLKRIPKRKIELE